MRKLLGAIEAAGESATPAKLLPALEVQVDALIASVTGRRLVRLFSPRTSRFERRPGETGAVCAVVVWAGVIGER